MNLTLQTERLEGLSISRKEDTMIDFDDPKGRHQLHAAIIRQLWDKLAAEAYSQYLKRGRGYWYFS